MFRFRLEIAGEVQMDRAIARFADGVSDYRPIWPVIADEFYAMEMDQFKSEGEGGGEKWAPLSPEYAGYKEAHFPGKPILERTGDLKRSLTDGNDVNAVRIEERKTLTLGSRLPYALYHQTGTASMPERQEIQFVEVVKRTMMSHIHAYLVQIATQSGFRRGMTPIDVSNLAGYLMKKPSVAPSWVSA